MVIICFNDNGCRISEHYDDKEEKTGHLSNQMPRVMKASLLLIQCSQDFELAMDSFGSHPVKVARNKVDFSRHDLLLY